MLADVASDDNLDLYFNNQTTERADRGIAPQYDPEDELKGFGGSDPAPSFNYGDRRMQAHTIASLANGTDEFRSTRMEKDAMPERDAARDARNAKLGKIRAIAQGAVLLRDIIASSKGGFAIGAIGGGEAYMQALQAADDDYNQRLNQWSQQNLAADRFNAEADNQDRLLNFRARQDKMDQNFRAGESEKDRALRIELAAKQREIDEAAIAARAKGASADFVRFTTDQQKFDYQQKTDALRYQQQALNTLKSEYNAMMSSQKNTPEGKALKKKIDQESLVEEQMRRQLSEHQIYDIDEPGTVQPERIDKKRTLNVNGVDYTIEELGWTDDQVRQYMTKTSGSVTGKAQ
jgi:hypothetical protein